MNTLFTLQSKAIKAAQDERWEEAVTFNQEMLQHDNRNIGALNRLGFALMQLQNMSEAQKTYQQVLEIDSSNAVAKKYLDIIKKKKPVKLPKALKHSDFVDEPGKTKSTQLARLAGPDVLSNLSVGGDCQIKCSSSRISVQCDGTYIGSLPDDLVARLRPLIEAGNQYTVKIQSLKNNTVTVFIRERERAAEVAHIASFPSESANVMALDTAELARTDEEPIYLGETGEEDDSMALGSSALEEALSSDEYHDEDDDEETTADTSDEAEKE
jgi:tetratricopeptide (TPR) repeat protein